MKLRAILVACALAFTTAALAEEGTTTLSMEPKALGAAATNAIGPALTIKASDVTFFAKGTPGIVSIDGKCGSVGGQPLAQAGKLAGTFKLPIAQCKTGLSLRDSHFLKYMGADKNPDAELALDPVEMKDEQKFTGKLKLKGKEAPVSGTMVFNAGKIEAKFTVNIKDFGMEKPGYEAITVSEMVNVEVKLTI